MAQSMGLALCTSLLFETHLHPAIELSDVPFPPLFNGTDQPLLRLVREAHSWFSDASHYCWNPDVLVSFSCQ